MTFLGLLAILFIALKLSGIIAWSWWWILLPAYAPVAIVLSIMAVACALYGWSATKYAFGIKA